MSHGRARRYYPVRMELNWTFFVWAYGDFNATVSFPLDPGQAYVIQGGVTRIIQNRPAFDLGENEYARLYVADPPSPGPGSNDIARVVSGVSSVTVGMRTRGWGEYRGEGTICAL
jgi:hypothetical protein